MKTYEITQRGERVTTVLANDPRDALGRFATRRGYPHNISGSRARAHLLVRDVGLFHAKHLRSTDERVEDAERRARSAQGKDDATAAAWEREAERRRTE